MIFLEKQNLILKPKAEDLSEPVYRAVMGTNEVYPDGDPYLLEDGPWNTVSANPTEYVFELIEDPTVVPQTGSIVVSTETPYPFGSTVVIKAGNSSMAYRIRDRYFYAPSLGDPQLALETKILSPDWSAKYPSTYMLFQYMLFKFDTRSEALAVRRMLFEFSNRAKLLLPYNSRSLNDIADEMSGALPFLSAANYERQVPVNLKMADADKFLMLKYCVNTVFEAIQKV